MPYFRRDKDEQRFEELFKAEYKGLLRYAISVFKKHGSQYVSVEGRAEEAVQETFSFAWEERKTLLSCKSPTGRLYKILYYKVMEMLDADRTWAKRLMQISERVKGEESTDFQLKLELESMISKNDYTLLKQLYLDGYSYKELCIEYGLTKSALAMRIKRIKERIQKEYESD